LTDQIRVRFEHGLGDCVYFAHQLPLYLRRGFDIVVSCRPDKEILFRAAGVPVADAVDRSVSVPWFEGEAPTEDLRFDNYWKWSKLARNLSLDPMPDIGHPGGLWAEYCGVALDARPFIADDARASIDRYASELSPPLVLLHAHGETDADRKDIPLPLLRRICHELLSATEATILLLDWGSKTPPFPHWRVRHVQHDFGFLDTSRLLSLLDRADLIAGVDSGPLHAARFTRTPSIGIWMRDGSPATWSLPREMQVNIVVGHKSRRWTRHARLPFNIIECEEPDLLPAVLGRSVTRMLAGSRYLPPHQLGRDILLQQFVRDWQGAPDNAFGGFNDRDRGFDQLLRIAARSFDRPLVVETGCIRSEEDFKGAGFSTLILAMFAVGRGGELVSIDHEPAHCDFARRTVACLGEAVEVIEGDSVEWLAGNRRTIDILHLDSRDSDQAGCAEQGLCEIQAAEDRLHHGSIVVFDDTCYANGAFIGSGALGVPWLLERGWRILHSGHQTILSRLTS
jgi:hypothetical protein